MNARNDFVIDGVILLRHHANFSQADGLTAWAMFGLKLRLVVVK